MFIKNGSYQLKQCLLLWSLPSAGEFPDSTMLNVDARCSVRLMPDTDVSGPLAEEKPSVAVCAAVKLVMSRGAM